jgi:hypothetical protein
VNWGNGPFRKKKATEKCVKRVAMLEGTGKLDGRIGNRDLTPAVGKKDFKFS